MHSPITWGEEQTGQGRLPFVYEYSGCTLFVVSDSTDVRAKDTFALSSYFQAMYMIDRECVQRGHAGTTIIGSGMVTKMFLINYGNPLSTDSNNIISLDNSAAQRRPLLPVRSLPEATIPSVSKPYVRCSIREIVPSTTECTSLISNLLAHHWTQSPIIWGLYQTGKGHLPFRYDDARCAFELVFVGIDPMAQETFALSSYVRLMFMMDRECVRRGYEGSAMVGGGHVIKAYLTTELKHSDIGADAHNTSVRWTLPGNAGDMPDAATPDLS